MRDQTADRLHGAVTSDGIDLFDKDLFADAVGVGKAIKPTAPLIARDLLFNVATVTPHPLALPGRLGKILETLPDAD
jgi:hypothetical protein